MQATSIVYRLAIALWLGGVAIFTLVLTPVLFKTQPRDLAGMIVGALFPSYFRWGLVCGATALACRLINHPEGWLPTVTIVIMILLTALQAFYIEPRAAIIKRQIPSFTTTSSEDPMRRSFSRLHGISAACNLIVLFGGIILVVLMV